MKKRKVCFFSTSGKKQIKKEQYSLQDIRILKEFGFDVHVATKLWEIPWSSDLYFSWWTSGSILPFIVAVIRNKPIIVIAGGSEAIFYRDSVSNEPQGYLNTPWYKKLATRITLSYATRILTVSEFMLHDVSRLGARDPIVVYNCVDTLKFNISSQERKYITTIFPLDKQVVKLKRGEEFIQSIPLILKEYPDQLFVIIGQKGNAFERLHKLCRTLGIQNNVIFQGSINNDKIANWLQASKLYVQISDTETFGVSIVEALSCGTPVVVSDRGAIKEIVGEYGIYVDNNDIRDIANGILKALSLTFYESQNLGMQLRARVEKSFSFKTRKTAIRQIISELID